MIDTHEPFSKRTSATSESSMYDVCYSPLSPLSTRTSREFVAGASADDMMATFDLTDEDLTDIAMQVW